MNVVDEQNNIEKCSYYSFDCLIVNMGLCLLLFGSIYKFLLLSLSLIFIYCLSNNECVFFLFFRLFHAFRLRMGLLRI